MLQLFRSFFKSKFGVGITLAFLVLIAFAFASSDVANTSLFGGVSGGDRVAVVGDERIDASELTSAVSTTLDSARQSNPTLTMQAFIAQGGVESVLDQLLQRTAIAEYARQHGMRAGKRLVDSEIAQIPAFRGIDGKQATATGVLPLFQTVVMGDKEYRFSLVEGERSFVRVTSEVCAFP